MYHLCCLNLTEDTINYSMSLYEPPRCFEWVFFNVSNIIQNISLYYKNSGSVLKMSLLGPRSPGCFEYVAFNVPTVKHYVKIQSSFVKLGRFSEEESSECFEWIFFNVSTIHYYIKYIIIICKTLEVSCRRSLTMFNISVHHVVRNWKQTNVRTRCVREIVQCGYLVYKENKFIKMLEYFHYYYYSLNNQIVTLLIIIA